MRAARPTRSWRGAPGKGAAWRYPDLLPEKVRRLLAHELRLIGELHFAPYFLTVHDIVAFARSKEILCQGRGSAANSAVCYVLGITAVDPQRSDLLFERFVSAERNEPPDIDIDFEHERREEVIQHVYETYGRDHAALAATVIRYRAKSAVREVAKVMGLSVDVQDRLSKAVWGWGRQPPGASVLGEVGLDPEDWALKKTLELTRALIDFPRHLSQHVGGFVIARSPLRELVPIENAAMAERTVVEWDKDDLDALEDAQDRRPGARHALLHPPRLRPAGHPLRRRSRPRPGAGRGPGRLRDAAGGRFDRRLPGREPGPDVDAAQAEAENVLRPRHRGGDRPPGADPGRHGPSLSAPPRGQGAGRVSLEGPRGGAGQDAGRAAVPGAGDAHRHRRRRLHALGGRRPQALDGGLPPPGLARPLPHQARRGHGRARLRAGIRRALLQADRRFRLLRLPREPRRQLCASGLRLLLAQMPLSGRLLRCHPQCPADGLLCPGPARPGRHRPRCRGP